MKLFINARTDIYLKRLLEGEAALAEALRRAEFYRAAGADGIFVPFANDPKLIETLAHELSLPLNVMGWSGVPRASELQALGVRRLSSATNLFRAAFAPLKRAIEAFLREGDPSALAAGGDGVPDLNARFKPPAS